MQNISESNLVGIGLDFLQGLFGGSLSAILLSPICYLIYSLY